MPIPNLAELALERAWHVYRMMHNDVGERDERRAMLDRFIRKLCEDGWSDLELMVVEALKYLKRLDEYGEPD